MFRESLVGRHKASKVIPMCAVALMLAGCQPDLPGRASRDAPGRGALATGTSARALEAATSTISPKGGRIELATSAPDRPEARVALEVPEGAFSSPVELKVSLLAAGQVAAGDGHEIAGSDVRIEPGGLDLERPATLSLPFIPADRGARHVSVLTRESTKEAWAPVPTAVVDKKKGTVSASLWHFSEFRPAYLVSDSTFHTAFDPERDGFGFADIGHNIGHPQDCPDGASVAFAAYASWFFEHKKDAALRGRYCSSCFDPQSLARSEVVERSRLLCEDGLALTCGLFLRFFTSWVSMLRGFGALEQAEDGDWQQYWSIRGAMSRTARPQLLLLGTGGESCHNGACHHSVLAIAYGPHSIKIYDPSYPEETRELTLGVHGMEEYGGRYVNLRHLSDYPLFKLIEEMGLFEAFEPKMCSPESCDGCDNDCDGDVDEEGASGCSEWHFDRDGDDAGVDGDTECLCAPDAARDYDARDGGDCDDIDANVRPGAEERCNGRDDDCDGDVDEGEPSGCLLWYKDGDGDGWGTESSTRCLCEAQPPYSADWDGDCDDTVPEVNPDGTELCNGMDDNCDGRTDEPEAEDCRSFFRDSDKDGHGMPGDSRCFCGPTGVYGAEEPDDCDDTDPNVRPSAEELCNHRDDDCDGLTDEEGALGCAAWHFDGDGDGAGVDGHTACLCGPDAARSYNAPAGGDCDDSKAWIAPGAPELCNLVDDDCDGDIDEDEVCVEPAFEDPEDTDTEDVRVTITQLDTTRGSTRIKLFARVETQHGKPLQRLIKGNFVLRETAGGVDSIVPVDSVFTAEGSSEAISAGLIIDASGSMGRSSDPNSSLGQAKAAAKLFVEELEPEDSAAVVQFGTRVRVRCEFTNNKQALFAAIDACADGGSTAMYDAILRGIDITKGRSGQRALVLLSDGGDNASRCWSRCGPNVAAYPAAEHGVPIFTIGLGTWPGSRHESNLIAISNQSFAGQDGSGYYSTGNAAGLRAIYDAIATALQNFYIVGWYTTGEPGEIVDVAITVSYVCANGFFADTFSMQYVVPDQ